jgi:hypothetical protein
MIEELLQKEVLGKTMYYTRASTANQLKKNQSTRASSNKLNISFMTYLPYKTLV